MLVVGKNGRSKMETDLINKQFLQSIKKKFGIAGSSEKIYSAIAKLLQAAPTDLTILITGETGTGKEVFANAAHQLSLRKKFPFVSVNCSAIPETLLESELFGHEKGAFTGATDVRVGFFESAHKGTIFLDEIGDMPLGTQVKILRVLESGEYSKLGSSDVKKVDVRVIAATNRELELDVNQSKFRRDLFFRLNNVQIKLPALREHTQDIPELVEFFAEKVCVKLGMNYQGITGDSINILRSLPWAGNIRELKNLIDTIITLEKGAMITPEILMKYIPPALPAYKSVELPRESSLISINKADFQDTNELSLIFRSLLEIKSDLADLKMAVREIYRVLDRVRLNTDSPQQYQPFEEVTAANDFIESIEDLKIEQVEKRMIELALKKFANNRRMAANSLGISERTLYRKLSEYGLL